MSINVYELSDSMSGSVTNEAEEAEVRELQKRFLIGQCQGFNDAAFQMERYAPPYINADAAGIYWVRRKLTLKGIGNRYWDVAVTYQTLQPKPGSDSDENNGGGPSPTPGSIAWDTTGHTEHITQALDETVSPGDEPSFDDAINVTGDSVQGIDVVRPSLRYTETWQFPTSIAVSAGFVGSVNELTGTTNLNQFRAFSAGEALFMGAKAHWRGDEPYVAVTFDFDCRRSGDFYVKGIAPVTKKGWEYCWVRYRDDVSGDSLIRRPRAVYKNKVYEEKDWSGLLITSRVPGATRSPRNPGTPTAAQQVANFLS